MVDDLATDGLVELAPKPVHRRSRLVRATPAGRAAADRLFTGSAPARDQMLHQAEVSAEDLRAAAALRRLLDHFAAIDASAG